MFKICLSVLLLASMSHATASGYGWYAYSFTWDRYKEHSSVFNTRFLEKLEEIKQKSNNPFKDALISEEDKTQLFDEIVVNYFQDGRADKTLDLKNVSPGRWEFYSVPALEFAFTHHMRKGRRETLFRHFERGRPLKTFATPHQCRYVWDKSRPWGRCMGAYIVFSPEEVRLLLQEAGTVLQESSATVEVADDLRILQQALRKAVKQRRAVYFEGHD